MSNRTSRCWRFARQRRVLLDLEKKKVLWHLDIPKVIPSGSSRGRPRVYRWILFFNNNNFFTTLKGIWRGIRIWFCSVDTFYSLYLRPGRKNVVHDIVDFLLVGFIISRFQCTTESLMYCKPALANRYRKSLVLRAPVILILRNNAVRNIIHCDCSFFTFYRCYWLHCCY